VGGFEVVSELGGVFFFRWGVGVGVGF
jgi:hypothetical protein